MAVKKEKRTEREEKRDSHAITELSEEYLTRHAKKFKRSWQEDERILNRDVLPVWGKRKVADITKRHINLLLESIVDRGAPIMANNTFKIVRRMFNYAVEKDILVYSPAMGLKMQSPKVRRERTLSETEISTLWSSLGTATMSDDVRRALRLILVTAQRPNEVIGMHTREIDGSWWTIPSERAKNGKAHRVFLTDTALESIGDLKIPDEKTGKLVPKGYIFACPHKSKDTSISHHALSRAIVNNCPSGCINDCGSCEDANCKTDKRKLDEKNRLGIIHFTPHDLRRTASTFMAEDRVMDKVIDAILNHVKGELGKIYILYRYDKEKRLALKKWEKRLKAITTVKPAAAA